MPPLRTAKRRPNNLVSKVIGKFVNKLIVTLSLSALRADAPIKDGKTET